MYREKTQTVLRFITGLVFLFSSLSKLMTIDLFEIYIYSFEWFSLNTSYIIARLIIGTELIIGLSLILNLYFRFTWVVSMITLSGFTLFLFYLQMIGDHRNCNCFGELIQLDPLHSILKNLIIIFLLAVTYKNKVKTYKFEKAAFIGILVLGLSLPSIISPPDVFPKDQVKVESRFNSDKLNTFLDHTENVPESFFEIQTHKKLVCLFSPSCKYCKLSAKKIEVISRKIDNKSDILFIFFGDGERINSFLDTTNTTKIDHIKLRIPEFFEISTGKMPEILLLENGKIISQYGYRSINEKEIIDFLRNSP